VQDKPLSIFFKMNSNTPIPSPYYANDRHRALLSLRVLSILASLAALSTLAWTIPAHENVSNDGVGSGVTPGVVASVRLTPTLSYPPQHLQY
jgi:hypothetical protein